MPWRPARALPWATLVAAVALARGAVLAVLVPPFQAPDEPAHFDYVQRLAEVGRLARPGTPFGRVEGAANGCDDLSPEAEALRALARPSFFHRERPIPPADRFHPPPDGPPARFTRLCSYASNYGPLYYAVGAGAYRAVRGAPLLTRLLAARLASALWGALGAAAAFLAGLWLLGGPAGGLALGLAYALQPTQSLLFSTVNNDAALLAACAAAFAAVAARVRAPGSRWATAAFAAASLLAALAKPTFLLAAPALLVAFAAASGPRRPRSWIAAALALLPGVAAGAAWQVRHPPLEEAVPSAAGGGLAEYVLRLLSSLRFTEGLWMRDYWMDWGWHDLRLPIVWYRVLELLLMLALLGAVLGWRRLGGAERLLVSAAALGTLLMLLPLYGFDYLHHRETGRYFLQGRYLLPLFVPQAAAAMVGLRGLARRMGSPGDPAFALPLALALMLGASAAHALARYHA